MTFFASMMMPTAPMTEITSGFKLSSGCVIALGPAPDACAVIGAAHTARQTAMATAAAFFAHDSLPFDVPVVFFPVIFPVLRIIIISFFILVFVFVL